MNVFLGSKNQLKKFNEDPLKSYSVYYTASTIPIYLILAS